MRWSYSERDEIIKLAFCVRRGSSGSFLAFLTLTARLYSKAAPATFFSAGA